MNLIIFLEVGNKMTAEEYIVRLIEISEKKLTLIKGLYDITLKQGDIIEKTDTTSLEQMIERKQALMDKADKLDEQFDVYFQRVKAVLGISSFEAVVASKLVGALRLRELIQEILRIIADMMKLEEQNKASANIALNGLSMEIKNVNTNKKFTRAYSPTLPSQPSLFIDKKN